MVNFGQYLLPTEGNKGNRSSDLGWLLWMFAASLPWLLPTHADPWTAFYSELLMAAMFLPLLVWALYRSKQAWQIQRFVIFAAALAIIPALQACMGLLSLPGEAVLLVIYLLAFAVSVSLGYRAETIEPYRLADSLFASLTIAATISTGLALYQRFGLDTLGVMVPTMVGGSGRAVANVAQPNNLSTLLVWGLVSLWWGYSRRSIGGFGAAIGAAFLLLGVALTGSRTGWVQIIFLGIAAVFARRILRTERLAAPLTLLALWFVFLVVAMAPLTEAFWGVSSRSASELMSTGSRPQFWLMALKGLADRPWLGYGWNQIVTVHVAFAAQFPGLKETMGHAHNMLLDLLLWTGIPVGLVIIGGLSLWGWRQIRAVSTAPHLLLLIAISVFIIHAMLELPHMYAFFLLPVGLMMGVVSALVPGHLVFTLPRATMGFVGLVFNALLVLIFNDYREIEANLTAHRMHAARIAGAAIPASPEIYILKPLQTALELLRSEPRRDMSPKELDDLHRTVLRYPTVSGLFRYAQSAALNGQPDEARWALDLICNLRTVEVCTTAIKDWQSSEKLDNQIKQQVVLPALHSFPTVKKQD